ncbi:hypothetical protein XVE_4351, partial [Xanthomonas vesicatoria ATCC 35937]
GYGSFTAVLCRWAERVMVKAFEDARAVGHLG